MFSLQNGNAVGSSEIPNSSIIAEGGNAPGQSSVQVDNQGNPVDVSGKLIVEEVASIDEITDEDFNAPIRSVQLPRIPENVANAIGAGEKPVIIKKSVFGKNGEAHEFTPEESRNILKQSLYNTDLYGQSQPGKRPNHWVVIKTGENSPITVIEVNNNKDNVEIVGWYSLDERNLERIKRQAKRNGSELVVLSTKDKVESFPTPTQGLSSMGEGTTQGTNEQEISQESGESAENRGENAATQGNKQEISSSEKPNNQLDGNLDMVATGEEVSPVEGVNNASKTLKSGNNELTLQKENEIR